MRNMRGCVLNNKHMTENKDDWPFFWGENEVTIGGSADYIFLAKAIAGIANK